MDANQEATLRQFCDVTGADEERSKFFLESSNWQIAVALSSFYEHGGNVDEGPRTPPPAVPQGPRNTRALPVMSDSDDSPPMSPADNKRKGKKPGGFSNARSNKFATLESLPRENSSDEEEVSFGWISAKLREILQNSFCDHASCSKTSRNDNTKSKQDIQNEIETLKMAIDKLNAENSELKCEIDRLKTVLADMDSGQAFYAGGSERSGQQILGPGKGRKDIISEMFKSVRERGAVVFEDEPSSTGRGRGGGGGAFSGVGYRLGQTDDDHEQVTPSATAQQQEPGRSVRLRLYREGFTVDNGPLRQYSDPLNAEFLTCIRRGEIPPELSSNGGGEVQLSLEDRRLEDGPRQTSGRPQAFTGKGQMLGSPTPATVGATAAVAAAPGDREANLRAAQDAVHLDTDSPTTTVQFRLADGTRVTGRFNHTHTVRDLREYVARAVPAYQRTPFALLTAFPSAELADPDATLAQAHLLNTTLLQRLK